MYKTEGEKTVDAFYREYLNASIYRCIMWIMCGIALLFEFTVLAAPLSAMAEMIKEGDRLMLFLLLVCSILAARLYLSPYQVYHEGEKLYSIEELLKYIPINHKDFCMVKTKRVAVFLAGVLPAAILLQTVTSIIAKTFSIWCVVYVFVVAFAVPLLAVVCFIWMDFIRKRDKKKGKLRNTIKSILQQDRRKFYSKILKK
uniref:hypothetical protein n=1 Tax=Agathobacter sp. TaxID=2021311 RepID=UPI00405722E5